MMLGPVPQPDQIAGAVLGAVIVGQIALDDQEFLVALVAMGTIVV